MKIHSILKKNNTNLQIKYIECVVLVTETGKKKHNNFSKNQINLSFHIEIHRFVNF